MEEPTLTFCILCRDVCLSFELSEREFFFCNNHECPRFGLLTAITTPIGNAPKEPLDAKDEHKKV